MPKALNLSRSLETWSRAEALIAGGTQTNSKRPSAYAPGAYPVYADRSQGCRVWDVNGKSYLDALGGIAVNTVGHNHPKLVAALRDQVGKIIVWSSPA